MLVKVWLLNAERLIVFSNQIKYLLIVYDKQYNGK